MIKSVNAKIDEKLYMQFKLAAITDNAKLKDAMAKALQLYIESVNKEG